MIWRSRLRKFIYNLLKTTLDDICKKDTVHSSYRATIGTPINFMQIKVAADNTGIPITFVLM